MGMGNGQGLRLGLGRGRGVGLRSNSGGARGADYETCEVGGCEGCGCGCGLQLGNRFGSEFSNSQRGEQGRIVASVSR